MVQLKVEYLGWARLKGYLPLDIALPTQRLTNCKEGNITLQYHRHYPIQTSPV